MRGDRDTEIAVLIEDTRFVKSQMDGVVYYVEEFSHSLRNRTSREIFGCYLDVVNHVENMIEDFRNQAAPNYKELYTVANRSQSIALNEERVETTAVELAMTCAFDIESTLHLHSVHEKNDFPKTRILHKGSKHFQLLKQPNFFLESRVENFVASINTPDFDSFKRLNLLKSMLYLQQIPLSETTKDQIIAENTSVSSLEHFVTSACKIAHITDPFQFFDPLSWRLWQHIWHATARENTKKYRYACRCEPDSCVSTKSEHNLFRKYQTNFAKLQDSTPLSTEQKKIIKESDELIMLKISGEDEKENFLSLFCAHSEIKKDQRKITSEKILQKVNGYLVEHPCDWLNELMESEKIFYPHEKNNFVDFLFK